MLIWLIAVDNFEFLVILLTNYIVLMINLIFLVKLVVLNLY